MTSAVYPVEVHLPRDCVLCICGLTDAHIEWPVVGEGLFDGLTNRRDTFAQSGEPPAVGLQRRAKQQKQKKPAAKKARGGPGGDKRGAAANGRRARGELRELRGPAVGGAAA